VTTILIIFLRIDQLPKSRLQLGGLEKRFEFFQWTLNPLPTPFPLKISSDLRELHKWPLAFRGEQLLHLLHTSYATAVEHNLLPSVEVKCLYKPVGLARTLRTCCCPQLSSASRNGWNCSGDLRLSTDSNFSFALNDVFSALMSSASSAVMTWDEYS